ncbi:MAG: hypothetical protein KDB07_12120 [Planctomycetes bacterium]|nr:hypothetical protein [Planctomycetota bacterium]
MKRRSNLLIALFCAASSAILTISPLSAEQVQLKDGRFIQGTVVEHDDKGMLFEITETKGRVRLAWSQISDKDAERLRKVEKKQEIDLHIWLKGVRITLIDGSLVEGVGKEVDGAWEIINTDYPKGRVFKKSDLEDGAPIETDINVDAFAIFEPKQVIDDEIAANPPEDAKSWYRMALIARQYRLYDEALTYLANAEDFTPDEALTKSIAELRPEIETLKQQSGALKALDIAAELQRKKKYQDALVVLKNARETIDKTSDLIKVIDDMMVDIDFNLTLLVTQTFYAQLPKEITSFLKRDKSVNVANALSFVNSELTGLVVASVASRMSTADYLMSTEEATQRLRLRLGDDEAAVKLRSALREQRATFGRKGWYQVVGGPLPNAGNIPQANNPDRDGDGIPADDLQARNREDRRNDRRDEERANDAARRANEAARDAENRARSRENGSQPDANDPRMKVPANTPSLNDYWKRLSSGKRRAWLEASFVRLSNLVWRDESSSKYEDIVFK